MSDHLTLADLGAQSFAARHIGPDDEQIAIALITLTLSGLSDYLDGKIARRYGLESRLGQLLDPFADRLYIATTLLGLAVREIIPWWLVWALVIREVLLAGVLWWVKRHGQIGLPVHFVQPALRLPPAPPRPGRQHVLGLGPAHRLGLRLVGHGPLLGRRRDVHRPGPSGGGR